MPFSDDLYYPDANHSDVESFSDELSPADGYFEREITSSAMVPDPSQASDDKTVEDKVLIPRPEPRIGSGSSSGPTNSPTLEQLHPSHRNASAASSAHVTSSPTANSPPAPRSFSRIHPDALIMGAAAPPAYSPSPAFPTSPQGPPSPQSPRDSRSYNTFGQPHLERHPEQSYRPNREPEIPNSEPDTMGSAEEGPNEFTPLSNIRLKKRSRLRDILRKLLLVALVFTVLAPILTTILKWKDSDLSKLPDKDIMPSPTPPAGPSRSYCPSARYKKDPVAYEFPVGGDFSVVQTTHDGRDYNDGYQEVKTVGEIHLRRLQKGSKVGDGKGYITVDISVSHPEIQVEWTLEQDFRFLKVSTPRFAKLGNTGPHCASLDIVAWLPEDAALTSLSLSSVTLELRVLDDIKIEVSGDSKLTSVTGNIYFPPPSSPYMRDLLFSEPAFRFRSRRIEVETVSGNISGLYPLLDYLRLVSHSGDIDVTVLPHDALPSYPAPADLDIYTTSGDVNVYLPVSSNQDPEYTPPPRDYTTKVGSVSGDISGTYYLGSFGEFETRSGDVKMKILPVVQYGSSENPDKDPRISFRTDSISGSIKVEMLDPIFISPITNGFPNQHDVPTPHQPIGDDDPYLFIPEAGKLFSKVSTSNSMAKKLRSLDSSHATKSGDIEIHYPDAWEGSVFGKTTTGTVLFEGKDLEVIKAHKGLVQKEVLARKRVDSGLVGSSDVLSTVTGDIWFVAGAKKS